ncbi:hypothetical protein LB565_20745 [Mesorhizobium sp. CA14]|uniref:hypothetical protein n=1 Tax=Mesorhizobium sp. CA14 TaxID=2876642 RepID=UPI001CCE740D|nr:hypothetical protein [Mesorhizobium sp. CA14]MBZ9850412.1 hypothetical protein [Mesorhizobium sp. CA14]
MRLLTELRAGAHFERETLVRTTAIAVDKVEELADDREQDGPHNVRDALATHILKQTGSYEQASYAIQDTPDMVVHHYGRFLPQGSTGCANSEPGLGSGVGQPGPSIYEGLLAIIEIFLYQPDALRTFPFGTPSPHPTAPVDQSPFDPEALR